MVEYQYPIIRKEYNRGIEVITSILNNHSQRILILEKTVKALEEGKLWLIQISIQD